MKPRFASKTAVGFLVDESLEEVVCGLCVILIFGRPCKLIKDLIDPLPIGTILQNVTEFDGRFGVGLLSHIRHGQLEFCVGR